MNKAIALITGASSGIGLELARQFAEHGYDLIVAAENDEIMTAAQELRRLGTEVEAVQVDLSTYDGVEELWRAVAGREVAAAAVNAGFGVSGRFVETDLASELRLISLNVTSAVHLAKRVLTGMAARGEGRVLFTASVASTMPGPYYAVYAASKAFVYSFAEAVRSELADSGVTVTALLPGPTDTRFFERADMEDTRAGTGDKDDPAEVARDGYEALMAGKHHVVAGSLKNKAQVAAAHVMPEPVKAKTHGRLTEPGSG
jgi:short-subunit dehydrogenase